MSITITDTMTENNNKIRNTNDIFSYHYYYQDNFVEV